jgi:hypothetical protein
MSKITHLWGGWQRQELDAFVGRSITVMGISMHLGSACSYSFHSLAQAIFFSAVKVVLQLEDLHQGGEVALSHHNGSTYLLPNKALCGTSLYKRRGICRFSSEGSAKMDCAEVGLVLYFH